MAFCRHLIDAAAKSGRYFLAEFFECGAAESKNFDKCHVKLPDICLIEIVGTHASDDILCGRATL